MIMVIFVWASDIYNDRKKRKIRESTVPYVGDSLGLNIKYNIFLNNGHSFPSVELIGTSDLEQGHFSFTGWEEMLIFKKESGKRVFLKQSSIRFIEEA